MYVLRSTSFLGVLYGLLQLSVGAAPHSVAALPGEVAMNQDSGSGGPLFVMLRLGSGERVPFMVDTGSPLTVLDSSLEPQLGKSLGTMRVANVGQPLRKENLYGAPKLYLGNALPVGGSRVATRDIKRTKFKRAKGILGMDYLCHYCIQMDFETRKVRFLDRERLNVSDLGKPFPMTLRRVGPQWKFLRPLVDQAPLCGTSTNVMVDTGCVPDGLMPRREMPSDGRGVGRTNLAECIWNGRIYTNLTVVATGQFYALGLGFLARHLVTLDFPGRMLYLKAQRVGPLAGPEIPVPNPQGGENGGSHLRLRQIGRQGRLSPTADPDR